MPNISLGLGSDKGETGDLENALSQLECVKLVNVDRGLIAVSYEGGESELEEIESAIKDAGFSSERTPGADEVS